MSREIAEIPMVARALCGTEAQAHFQETGEWLRHQNPASFVTIARGSSDHAVTSLKYAIELLAGVPVASMGPSIASLYNVPLHLERVVALAISQSGGSADLQQLAQAIQFAGGHTLALTNTKSSLLAKSCDHVLDIRAGEEHAVAATKSYTNSILSGLWVLGHWRQDKALMDALTAYVEPLEQAMTADISNLVSEFSSVDRLVVLGRGPTLGIAQEIALKAMEVCAIPAAAYSGAEVLHGPSSILRDGFPVLAIAATAKNGVTDTVTKLQNQGARIIEQVQAAEPDHIVVPSLYNLVVIYRAMEAASRAKGLNPDKPINLKKITSTV